MELAAVTKRFIEYPGRLLLLLVLLFCFACKNKQEVKQEKFDKVKWAAMEGPSYPYRDAMLQDLLNNYELHGLTKEAIMDLLGKPTRADNGYLFYQVHQELLGNTFPVHTKTLVIKLKSDSTVEWRKIHE